jgi:hypothetical protein
MTYMRIFEKIKNIVKKNEGVYKNQRQYYDLKSSELCALYEGIREKPYDGICCAFDYGFIKGMRYYKKYGDKKK